MDKLVWFVAQTATEAYLQQELRHLHAVIEALGDWPPEAPSLPKDTAP